MLLLKLFYDIRHRKCKLKKTTKKGEIWALVYTLSQKSNQIRELSKTSAVLLTMSEDPELENWLLLT